MHHGLILAFFEVTMDPLGGKLILSKLKPVYLYSMLLVYLTCISIVMTQVAPFC